MDLSPPPTALSDLDDVAEGSTAATSVSVCDGRGNKFTVDQDRFTANAERVRNRLLPGVEVWQVAKGNGYGLGVELAVRLGHRAGMRSFCVGTPAEALRVRRVAPGCSVLLFTACPPDITAELAAQQVIVTVNSLEAYQALVDSGSPSRFFLELDCGFGRYGLSHDDLQTLRARYCERQPIKCVGAYTHFGMATERLLQSGTALFDLMVEEFTRGLTRPIATMVASTETILESTSPGLQRGRSWPAALWPRGPRSGQLGDRARPPIRDESTGPGECRWPRAGGPDRLRRPSPIRARRAPGRLSARLARRSERCPTFRRGPRGRSAVSCHRAHSATFNRRHLIQG